MHYKSNNESYFGHLDNKKTSTKFSKNYWYSNYYLKYTI